MSTAKNVMVHNAPFTIGGRSPKARTNNVTDNDPLIEEGFDGLEEVRCPAMDRKRAENAQLLKDIDDVLLPAAYDGGTKDDTSDHSSSSRGEPIRNVRRCFQARTPDPDACETAALEKRYKSQQANNKTFNKNEDVLLPLEIDWDE
ncbi:MAG: hypothetical protein GY832_18770 [Chloroflexi bacterium]|nr:hypothetical protein [Chloroflexota bacterium]